VPEVVSFEGYLGATITRRLGTDPDENSDWCVFYLDWDLRRWLLIEKSGIVRHRRLQDEATPKEDPHDVIWVLVTATVGSGRGSQSVEGLFLTGSFTSAGDFEAEAGGDGASPATGKFCGRSPWCCGGRTVCLSRTR